ncbi:MAG: hypothetical protein KDC27_12515 [Acidobacteria bacterium]|nr:hypothetical protein [Acidobacteriota bacterium]
MGISHRRQAVLENEKLRVVVLPGGGHIASITLRSNPVNPLWDPPWETIEPSQYDAAKHGATYGDDVEGRLLSGIAGHNLCFDLFGVPSEAEAKAGLDVHGEASSAEWQVEVDGEEMLCRADFPLCGMAFERRLRLGAGSQVVTVTETAINRGGVDRPVGWTQHVTLGPPFLDKGKTRFHAPGGASKTLEARFAPGHERFPTAAEFQWPYAPLTGGGFEDLRTLTDEEASGAFTTHLMAPDREQAYFTAWSPASKLAFGYIWKRSDFPWLGIWEENSSRAHAPWSGRTLTRGMEFGASPFPETRQACLERGSLFGHPVSRWIPAGGRATAEYRIFLAETDREVESVEYRDGAVRAPGLFELA